VTSHYLKLPLDYSSDKEGETIMIFVREVVATKNKERKDLPYVLYLQGGPGFPSRRPAAPSSGWTKQALEGHRVLLLDQRGTGLSSPVTAQTLAHIGAGAEAQEQAILQANYLVNFRADSIVRDCERIREAIVGPGKKLTLLGQSFGGFCILTYLSLFPDSIEQALFTCGLAPVLRSADEVYRATYTHVVERNRRYYARFPMVRMRITVRLSFRSAPKDRITC
jgi:pimeloyl-ACP methyl ester carboxylesterase